MAKILAILCSGRKKGYTAGLLSEAINGAKEVSNSIEVDLLQLHDYKFSPCTSCFHCIRDADHNCILDDDFGKNGKGKLFQKVENANGWIIADPVYMWGPSSQCHLFFERCYPFVWSGKLEGMPMVSISCATNQGMHRLAYAEICKWAFAISLRYIDGLAVHASYYQDALKEAKHLGRKLAEFALSDEKDGRKKFANDEEKYIYYMDKPWNAFIPYMDNLSHGSFGWQLSMMETALRRGIFKREDAVDLLKKSVEEFKEAVKYYNLNDYQNATKYLVRASSYWTHATWKEFLEEQAIKSAPPSVYRPLPKDEK
ncbi:TPA: flavodoxin family protein [Candidatus Poribacteria bacterium]|nr:flavodoxin family protein [Candidatus Poribacteria bacterium]